MDFGWQNVKLAARSCPLPVWLRLSKNSKNRVLSRVGDFLTSCFYYTPNPRNCAGWTFSTISFEIGNLDPSIRALGWGGYLYQHFRQANP